MFPLGHRVRVKNCCISTLDEAFLAIKEGADALGLVAAMPSGPGIISDGLIGEIARRIPPPVASVLLTSRVTANDIIDHVHACGANTVQIVSHVDPSIYEKLHQGLPASTRIIQVVHVENEYASEIAQDYAALANALLLDSGTPSQNKLGGTGQTHNWDFSRHIVQTVDIPVFRAGGLNSSNIRKAIHHVRPYGVDLCSGIRTNGKLDNKKLREFMAAVRLA
ncbi:phosphoribosylanthranilate isomerase [Flexibacterium corallicola]|uniref:phosphoribosylanthranilate isomerase n=1 Tax=Flexibacterium corallicola TaxID=3037259 RepID=UPI00286F4051|nr:phosphoribosylanthranilate isomerase [Pseudovibrio sp. M1P-2-3]